MVCPVCGFNNTGTFPSADGIIYCRHCGEPQNDCCVCGSRKGVFKAKDVDTSIRDETLVLCETCQNILMEDRRK